MNYEGKTFGQLTGTRLGGYRCKNGRIWLWECACGTLRVLAVAKVINGRQQSCGCRRKLGGEKNRTHGYANVGGKISPTYRSWITMKVRVRTKYHNRGIGICERWATFENFLEDMGERPSGMTLDRIDNNGIYEPSNCRWADATTQALNRRNTAIITFNGITKPRQEWIEAIGLSRAAFSCRLAAGWSLERALTEPPDKTRRNKKARRRVK